MRKTPEDKLEKEIYDVLILGSGPAGLQAAIHAARRKVSVIIVGKIRKSSAYNASIENFCCIEGTSGEQMLESGQFRAKEAGAVFLDDDIIKLEKKGNFFEIQTESGKKISVRAVIFAMGISHEKLNVKGEKALLGKGISYCVDCDAGFYRGETVAVVGGGSAAVYGALTLLFYANEVHLICEKVEVADLPARELMESAIIVHEGRRVSEITGKDAVRSLILDDGSEIQATGVFIELGARGITELASSLDIEFDRETMRYIRTNKKQETNIPGVYAAGDICGPPWQVAKAVGEGCIAGLEAAAWVKRNRERKDR
jgi:thioredoxin reductase (NADPH)